MADDIVTRLRVKDGVYTEFWQQKLMDEAADEIERLRAEVERLRAAGDALAEALDRHGSHSFCTMLCSVCVNGAAWQEARCG